jgi:hypothetical protein
VLGVGFELVEIDEAWVGEFAFAGVDEAVEPGFVELIAC